MFFIYNHVIVEHEMLRKKFPSEPVGRYPIQHNIKIIKYKNAVDIVESDDGLTTYTTWPKSQYIYYIVTCVYAFG